MRHDMHKVIVERPRFLRASWSNKKTASRLGLEEQARAYENADEYDSGPCRASSSRHEKGLNENLMPLKRYLHKQVGRPWNKVYSEICATLDTRSAVGKHVLQHIEDFVLVNTFIEDGVVYARRRCWKMRPVDQLYVHPISKLVRLPKPRMKNVIPRDIERLAVSDLLEFQKRKGLWFRIEFRFLPLEELGPHPARSDDRAVARTLQCDRKTIQWIEQAISNGNKLKQ